MTSAIAGSAAALLSLTPVALYQLGAVQHLPDPPSRWFDSDRITSSRIAHPFGIPDSLLGMASYGVTLGLALAVRRGFAARKLLAGKIVLDTCLAGVNAVRQVIAFRRICSWCMGTVLSTAVAASQVRRLVRR
jgi:uncharacterized membrane protein